MFVFGGLTQFGNTNDLWSLDLTANSWALVPTNFIQLPSARVTHVCMYDSLLNRMLLWSGQGSTLYNDVWAFNFVNEKNKQFSFLKCSPNPSNGNTRLSFNVSEK